MSKYPKQPQIQPNGTVKFACCDCGLVHIAGVNVSHNGAVHLAFVRDERATAQLRRHNFGDLQKRKSKRYKLLRSK